MAGLENEILHVLGDPEEYKAYREYLPEEVLSPVSRRLLGYIDKYWDTYSHTDTIDWNDFSGWLQHYAATKDSHLEAMVQVCDTTADVEVADTGRDILDKAVERDIGEQIEGHLSKDDEVDPILIRDLCDKLEQFKVRDLDSADSLEVNTNIEDVLRDSHVTGEGLPFSLDILRKSVGPLRPGDTMYVVKRPEVGGTTFLVQQTGYMMENSTDTNALIFSNEEDGNRVMIRLYQSVLGWTTKDVMANPVMAREEYERRMGDINRIRIIHSANLHRKDCERVIEKYNPDLIVFNMLSKISGFGTSKYQNDVDMYSAQGVWMRELANAHTCAAMTAWQAGSSAHGKAWLEQDDMYGSKTGVVAEADVILGIGKVLDIGVPEDQRYLHLSKNKLPGDSYTDEKLRHGYFDDVWLNAEIGRYHD